MAEIPILLLALAAPPADADAGAGAIPYFARRYDVSCATCHALPPKLNAFGEAFRRNGYRAPGLRAGRAVPVAVWATARGDALAGAGDLRDEVVAYLNRLELISGGTLGVPWLSYFVEWRALSRETRADGTIRDRSGRFEDLFVTASAGGFALTAGQFRLVDQVDVSLRLGLSEPLSLAASLPGAGGATARRRSLRAFAPAARSPAVRGAWTAPAGDWSLTASAAVPVPGELSLPLGRAARREASNELEWLAKGVVVESFVQRGVTSFGAHAFYDHRERYLVNAVHAGRLDRLYWTAVGGVERQSGVLRGRWSVEGELLPSSHIAVGARVEDRAGDGAPRALLPFLVAHAPGTRFTVRFTLEQRVQRGRHATLAELGAVF